MRFWLEEAAVAADVITTIQAEQVVEAAATHVALIM